MLITAIVLAAANAVAAIQGPLSLTAFTLVLAACAAALLAYYRFRGRGQKAVYSLAGLLIVVAVALGGWNSSESPPAASGDTSDPLTPEGAKSGPASDPVAEDATADVGLADLNGEVLADVGNGDQEMRLGISFRVPPDSTRRPLAEAVPGGRIEVSMQVANIGLATIDEVALGVRLPDGFTFVEGTTEWISGHTAGEWTDITGDWHEGGLNIGGYLPEANAYVRFTVLAPEGTIRCGSTSFTVTVFGKPEGWQSAQVDSVIMLRRSC